MRQTTAPDLGSGLAKTGRTRLYPVIYIGLFPLRAEAHHRNKRPRKFSNQTLLIPLIARFKKNPQWGPLYFSSNEYLAKQCGGEDVSQAETPAPPAHKATIGT